MALPSYRDFLDRLQRDGVIHRLDPRTLQAVEELLDAGLAHHPAEFAAALASLLASTPQQWRQVEARLGAFLRDPAAFVRGAMPVHEPPPLPTAALDLHRSSRESGRLVGEPIHGQQLRGRWLAPGRRSQPRQCGDGWRHVWLQRRRQGRLFGR